MGGSYLEIYEFLSRSYSGSCLRGCYMLKWRFWLASLLTLPVFYYRKTEVQPEINTKLCTYNWSHYSAKFCFWFHEASSTSLFPGYFLPHLFILRLRLCFCIKLRLRSFVNFCSFVDWQSALQSTSTSSLPSRLAKSSSIVISKVWLTWISFWFPIASFCRPYNFDLWLPNVLL